MTKSFLLAAYDPAYQAADGTYWAWKHPAIPPSIADRFYYEVAAKCRPSAPNQLTIDDFQGGFATLGEGWRCWYRFLDGGYDSRGRPGRFVIVCAFLHDDEAGGEDGFSLLESPFVLRCSQEAKSSRRLPAPASLEENPHFASRTADPVQTARLLAARQITVEGDSAWDEVSALCGMLPNTHRFVCQVERVDGRTSARCWAADQAFDAATVLLTDDTEDRPTMVGHPGAFARDRFRWLRPLMLPVLLLALALFAVPIYLRQSSPGAISSISPPTEVSAPSRQNSDRARTCCKAGQPAEDTHTGWKDVLDSRSLLLGLLAGVPLGWLLHGCRGVGPSWSQLTSRLRRTIRR